MAKQSSQQTHGRAQLPQGKHGGVLHANDSANPKQKPVLVRQEHRRTPVMQDLQPGLQEVQKKTSGHKRPNSTRQYAPANKAAKIDDSARTLGPASRDTGRSAHNPHPVQQKPNADVCSQQTQQAGRQGHKQQTAHAEPEHKRHKRRLPIADLHPSKQQKTEPGISTPVVTANATAPGSNWAAWQQVIKSSQPSADSESKPKLPHKAFKKAAKARASSALSSSAALTPIVAMDCEMVGVGPGGERSALARVCIVNNEGVVLLDTFVKPKEMVTDYRTKVSGVRPSDLKDAPLFDTVVARVAELVKGRMVVGHALGNDLAALMLEHPREQIRDTACYPPLMSKQTGSKPRARALRHLAAEQLGLEIQAGEHTPVDDARAALYIYHKHRREWEAAIASGKLRTGPAKVVRKRKATGRDGKVATKRKRIAATEGATSIGSLASLSAEARILQAGRSAIQQVTESSKRSPGEIAKAVKGSWKKKRKAMLRARGGKGGLAQAGNS